MDRSKPGPGELYHRWFIATGVLLALGMVWELLPFDLPQAVSGLSFVSALACFGRGAHVFWWKKDTNA